jgi:NHL repeat-containing protein
MLAFLGTLAALVLAFTSAPALAVTQFGGTGSGNGQFSAPAGVAIEQSSGDVYVVDSGNARVQKFDSAGNYLSQFDGSSTPAKSFSFVSSSDIAVDNSSNPLDPSAGDVYVVDSGHNVIDKFSPLGVYIGQIAEAGGEPFFGITAVTVDTNGGVWVYDEESKVDRFDDEESNGFVSSWSSTFKAGPGIAVGPDGTVYVARRCHCAIDRYSSEGAELGELPEAGGAVAVSEMTGNIYTEGSETIQVNGNVFNGVIDLRQYDAAANPVGHFGVGLFSEGNDLAVSASTGVLYISAAGLNIVYIFAPPPPAVEGTDVPNVGISTATLRARITPTALPSPPVLSDATYHFELGTDTSYGISLPASGQDIGQGTNAVTVTQAAVGLQADTTYHYRVVTSNALGTTASTDHTFTTFSAIASNEDSCPNATVRATQHATQLPQCRAYEMVSPLAKNGGNVAADPSETQSSVDGNAVKYTSLSAFTGVTTEEPRGAEYIAERGSDGWSTHAINPPQVAPALSVFLGSQYSALSPDLSMGVYFARSPVLSGHPNEEGVPNLYLRTDLLDGAGGTYDLLSEASAPLPPREAAYAPGLAFVGASADWSKVFFESVDDLTPDTESFPVGQPKLYEWDKGILRLVGVLPGGKAAENSTAGYGAGGNEAGAGGGWTESAVSPDGSRVIFEANLTSNSPSQGNPQVGDLYMRIDHRETIQLNVSERVTPDPSGAGTAIFWTASTDGSKIFFTADQALTEDASLGVHSFYMYNINAPAGKHLTLLASEPPGSGGSNGITAGNAINGISADGSYVYFTSTPLLPGDPLINNVGNLYVWHDGNIRFVTSEQGVNYENGVAWGDHGRYGGSSFRVGEDGKKILFANKDPLTAQQVGYDLPNIGSESNPSYHSEVYVYDYDASKLTCVSCDSTKASPVGDAEFKNMVHVDQDAVYIPTGIEKPMYLNRAMTSDGHYVFFDTEDPLLPQDTNGKRDVYEYDTVAERLYLISTGNSSNPSFFVDASPDGHDVFFTGYQSLVKVDTDNLSDLYDARVDGGIASQNAPPAPACGGEDCQGPAKGAPRASLPASSTFAGTGNIPPRPTSTKTTRVATKATKLSKALRACRRHKQNHRRAVCEKRARKKYKASDANVNVSHRVGR